MNSMAKVKLVAGQLAHLEDRNVPVIIIDIGFSKEKASTGIGWVKSMREELIEGANLKEVKYGEMVAEIKQILKNVFTNQSSVLHIVIEAPLSAKFEKGNPKERGNFERGYNKSKNRVITRYWYQYGGLLAFVAAGHLIRQLAEEFEKDATLRKFKEIRFFEGFVSFKDDKEEEEEEKQKPHIKDVKRLYSAIKDPSKIAERQKTCSIENVHAEEPDERVINIFHMFELDGFNKHIEVPEEDKTPEDKAPIVIVCRQDGTT